MDFTPDYRKLLFVCLFIFSAYRSFAQNTIVSGVITDAANIKNLPYATISFVGASFGVTSDNDGKYSLSTDQAVNKIKVALLGYKEVIINIKPGKEQVINVKLSGIANQLKEVVVKSARKKRYRNKDNPAVELIRKVIENKEKNRPENYPYVEYKEYDKVQLAAVNIKSAISDRKVLHQYKFMLDNRDSTSIPGKSLLPVFLDEKVSQFYYRKNPEMEKSTTLGEKTVNFGAAMDYQGIVFYIKHVYAKVDIYANDIFLIATNFLSPIANTAPTFYKYFITDTIVVNKQKLVELSFTPRNTTDRLLEGKIYISLDGNYAVQKAELTINKNINLNFVNSLTVTLEFQQNPDGRYHLGKGTTLANFSITQNGKGGILGIREIVYGNYAVNKPHPDSTYNNPEKTVPEEAMHRSDEFWKENRLDTLKTAESKVYKNADSLRNMKSFRVAMNVATFLFAGYEELGAVEIGPSGTFYSFNPIEGNKFRFGGRTTPELSKRYYFETYGAYGTKDKKWKGFLSATYSINDKSIYQFPQNYIRASVQYDTYIPGQNLQFVEEDNLFLSLKRGNNDKYLYDLNYKLNYVHEYENHFSYNIGFQTQRQTPAGSLYFANFNSNNQQQSIINLNTADFTLSLRYAPNEQFYQGKIYRYTVPSKYPVFHLDYDTGIKNIFSGQYSYQKLHARIEKTFYLSVFGYADVNAEAGHLFGQAPYPVLNLFHANQTYSYEIYSYNLMNFLEFVADHYESISIDQHFNGFFFNKIPLFKKLKWRETASLKAIYGGLSNQNNPSLHPSLYQFPVTSTGQPITYGLGNTPYVEASVGIENIFKFIRVDLVHRFTYLDHPEVAKWGIRTLVQFSF